MAADNKIWVIALFMLISFVFNWLKKKRQSKNSDSFNDENLKEKSNIPWGITNIIDQFEVEYGNVQKKAPVNIDYIDSESLLVEDVEEVVVKTNEKESKTNKVDVSKKKSFDAYANDGREIIFEDDEVLDLKEMIIHNAILNRPDF
jgi:hypothetical protein